MYKIYFNSNFILLLDSQALVPDNVQICEFDITKMLQIVENNKNVAVVCEDSEEIFNKFSTFFDVHEAAGGLVRSEKGNYLMIYRNNVWDLAKGHLEKGESLEQCALREVREECGIESLELEKFLCVTMHIYTLKKHLVLKKSHWFAMKSNETEKLKAQREEGITRVKWLSKKQIEDVKGRTYQSIRDVLSYIS